MAEKFLPSIQAVSESRREDLWQMRTYGPVDYIRTPESKILEKPGQIALKRTQKLVISVATQGRVQVKEESENDYDT